MILGIQAPVHFKFVPKKLHVQHQQYITMSDLDVCTVNQLSPSSLAIHQKVWSSSLENQVFSAGQNQLFGHLKHPGPNKKNNTRSLTSCLMLGLISVQTKTRNTRQSHRYIQYLESQISVSSVRRHQIINQACGLVCIQNPNELMHLTDLPIEKRSITFSLPPKPGNWKSTSQNEHAIYAWCLNHNEEAPNQKPSAGWQSLQEWKSVEGWWGNKNPAPWISLHTKLRLRSPKKWTFHWWLVCMDRRPTFACPGSALARFRSFLE